MLSKTYKEVINAKLLMSVGQKKSWLCKWQSVYDNRFVGPPADVWAKKG